MCVCVLDDRPRLILAFVPLSIEVRVLDDRQQLMFAFVSWSIEACVLTIDHSLCLRLCHCLLRCVCVCVLDDRPQLMLAFVPLSIEVCVFDDPFKRQAILYICLLLGFLSGADKVSVLTAMWHSVTGSFVSDVWNLQCCMCTGIFFLVDFMFSFMCSVDVN